MKTGEPLKVGEELRKAREEAGMTQGDLAAKANVHRTYISQVERDVKTPTLTVFFRLCYAMKIAPSKVIARIERIN
jgi:transcriptional regulator with XRE-family HTH domain